MNIRFFFLSVTILTVFFNCGKHGLRYSPVNYPSLAEQRSKLSAKPYVQPVRLLDSLQIVSDLQYLASDTCQGRAYPSAGHERATIRISERFRETAVDSFNNSLVQEVAGRWPGKNVIGWLKGNVFPDKYIVVSAHYDHLGKTTDGKIYYGADDNASGVACLLALAKYYKLHPHPYSIIFAAFDREEDGMRGANFFVEKLAADNKLSSVVFNLNLDMIARSDRNEIFACGIEHTPAYKYVIDSVQYKTNVKLLMGHDGGSEGQNWTNSSDHAAFHNKSIPFLYIGVEDHIDCHRTTDTYSKINYNRYLENCNMIVLLLKYLKP